MQQSVDDLSRIVSEETQECSDQVQEFASDCFREFVANGEETIPDEICAMLLRRIHEVFEVGDERKNALSALDRIRNRVAAQSVQNTLQTERDRQSLILMHEEGRDVLDLVRRQGRGVVYFGSSRSKPGESRYERTRELAREMFQLLGCTTWSGAGPGDMDASVRGAKEAGGRIAGVKIHLEKHQSEHEQEVSPVFDTGEVVECEYFVPRKLGLVDAAMRENESDRTGVIVMPGGYGTMDEAFEFTVLKQLKKLGTKYDVPVVLMNYSGEYDGIEVFIDRAVKDGRISEEERNLFHICRSNQEVLDYFADFYKISAEQRTYHERLCDLDEGDDEEQ